MISETQYYVVNVGDDVSMECSFHADRYSMFDHPVLWRKQQLDESSQINILGSINDPFIQTNRYQVTFDAAEPRYQLQLRISGHAHTQNRQHCACKNVVFYGLRSHYLGLYY